MAPSPNSSINTPGQAGAVPSPFNPNEEQLYREKYRHLTKYIEPLKRMVARIGNDGKDSSEYRQGWMHYIFSNLPFPILDEKLLKMNKLLEILCNPNKRIPLDTLLKCEIALEKMDFKAYLFQSSGSQFGGTLKEHPVSFFFYNITYFNLKFRYFDLIRSIIHFSKLLMQICKVLLEITHYSEHSVHV